MRLATVAWECNFLKEKVLEALENPVKREFSRAFLRSGAETVKYHKLPYFAGDFLGRLSPKFEHELVCLFYDYCYENTDEFLASIVWEENHLEVIYCQGGGSDVEQYFAEISLKSSFPNKIELPTDFNINSKSCKQIQVVTYADRSSKIKYHFELETVGSKKLISKQNTVNIAVPIYETSGGFFNILREWLIENNIIYYKYNDRPLLQQKIVYRNPIKKKI